MSLTYGFEVKSHDDPFLAAAERGVTLTEEATVPGGYLVNTLPICTHQAWGSVLHILSVIDSETHPIMVSWSQVQALRTSWTGGP